MKRMHQTGRPGADAKGKELGEARGMIDARRSRVLRISVHIDRSIESKQNALKPKGLNSDRRKMAGT